VAGRKTEVNTVNAVNTQPLTPKAASVQRPNPQSAIARWHFARGTNGIRRTEAFHVKPLIYDQARLFSSWIDNPRAQSLRQFNPVVY
jgi:hypothetical protein